ncbi:MAG: hypothetical protein ACC661_02230 [Verrucomicrobiales bacterium]
MVSQARQLQILANWNLRILRIRIESLLRESRLMVATLALFLTGYLVIGYLLFSKGLSYIYHLPAIGGILSERILYLIFFFVFVMLVISNAAVQYSSLLRNRETAWLLSLPIDHRVLFFWKILESLVISSWGFLFMCAPLLAAYGTLGDAPWHFYPVAAALILPLVALPAALSSWLLLLLTRLAGPWLRRAAALGLGCGAALYGWRLLGPVVENDAAGGNIALALNAALRHTRISVHPLVPSTWWTDALIQWTKGLQGPAFFNFLLLLGNSLMAMMLTLVLAGAWFFPAWNRAARSSAERGALRRAKAGSPGSVLEPLRDRSLLPLSRTTRALLLKDAREFARDTAQWIQVAVIFGLLLLYVLNLRNLGYNLESPFWSAVVSLLNLTVCALGLSTLSTRFVFPQFSLEGHRLWIVGMAPFPLSRVLLQKLLLNLSFTGGAATALMLISGFMLRLPAERIVLYVFSIALLSFGLNALALSLGAIFPNLRETNPAKIVSGFGGTLCLISSLVYITLFIALLATASSVDWIQRDNPSPPASGRWPLAIGGVIALTAAFGAGPLFLAIHRVKKLELLGNL